jgi:hypothetical protein
MKIDLKTLIYIKLKQKYNFVWRSDGTHDYVFQCNNCVDVGEEAIEASFAEVSTRS